MQDDQEHAPKMLNKTPGTRRWDVTAHNSKKWAQERSHCARWTFVLGTDLSHEKQRRARNSFKSAEDCRFPSESHEESTQTLRGSLSKVVSGPTTDSRYEYSSSLRNEWYRRQSCSKNKRGNSNCDGSKVASIRNGGTAR